jgi:hypothetical protein
MFRSDFFDLFSRTHPAMVPILFVPGALVGFTLSIVHDGRTFVQAALLCLGGFVSWTLRKCR